MTTAAWQLARREAWGRDCGRCVRCGVPVVETWDTHHRKQRSVSGSDALPNLLTLCRVCHGWCHDQLGDARAQGYVVDSWAQPEDVAIYQLDPWTGEHRWAFLHPDGWTTEPPPWSS